MKKLFKKNQVIITALALMIAAAGYLSYTYSGIGDDGLKQASADLTEEDYDIVYDETPVEADIFTESEIDTQSDDESSKEESKKGKQDKKDGKNKENDDKETAAADGSAVTDAVADSKAGDEAIDNPGETVLTSTNVSNVNFAVEAKLMQVINSTALSDKEKQAAVDKMVAQTDIAQRESDAEMLLEAKGFTDVVVSITEDSADVVLNMGDVTDAKRAQIEDIVKRKTKVSAENIVITPITTKKAEK